MLYVQSARRIPNLVINPIFIISNSHQKTIHFVSRK